MKKILLIDDNEQDRLLYKRFLGKQVGHERFEISEACSGAEGLMLFRTLRPDCVLLDHNLLDTDGLTLLGDLQELTPPDTLCVVMITGGGSEALAVRALNNGALDYLVKQHFDPEMLYKTVTHAIEKNEWRQYVSRYHLQLQAVNQQLRESLEELTETRQQIQQTNAQLKAANEEVQARNEELGAANDQLARTNADLDNFVYAASHDLRQPVHNLRGLFDELQLTATFQDPDADQMLQLMDASLNDLSVTISDLAAVVQEARKPGEQIAEPVALADLTADILLTLRPQLQDAEADIRMDFETLPEIEFVRSNLRTVLLNLIGNAVKYRHPDRPAHIQLRSRLAGKQPILEVQDNGLGIDLDRHGSELFQLFRRFHPHAGEGTGVGLFLVNRIVQAEGGRIEVESQPEQGTTFRVYLRG